MRNIYLTIQTAAKQSVNSVMNGCAIAAMCLLVATSTQAQTFPKFEVEPNGTAATATPITSNPAKMRGYIQPNADVDFYSFTANAGDKVYAATQTAFNSSGSTISRLELIALDGVTIIEFDLADGTFGASSSSIAGATIPSNGTYYLRVAHTSATAQLRPYDLYLRVQSGSSTAETESNNTNLTANTLPLNGWVNGSINPAADGDFYTLNLNAGESVFLSLDLDPERDNTTWNGILGFGLFGDADNLTLTINDANITSPNSEAFFFTVKNSGTYYVYVSHATALGGTTFTYNLSVSKFAAETGYVNYASANVPLAITDAGTISSTLSIVDSKRIKDISVRVNLTHPWMNDVDATLTSPNGNTVHLFSDIGYTGTGTLQTQLDFVLNDNNAITPNFFTALKGTAFQPELQGFLDYFKGQNTAGAWTLRLYDDFPDDSGTLNSWSIDILEDNISLNPTGTYPVYSTNFESNDGGFTSSGTANEWAWGTPATLATVTPNPIAAFTTANSGINAWKTDLTGTYNFNSNQTLESPNIDLTSSVGPLQVNWAMKYQMESASFDGFSVFVEEVGGGGLVKEVFRWYGATQIAGLGTPINNVPQSAGWGIYQADISAFVGKTIRFKVNVVGDNSVSFAGVAIDDVQLLATCPVIALSPSTLPDGTVGVAYSTTLSQTGGAGVGTFAITTGTLPGGLILNPSGLLSGTPNDTGTFTFTVTVTDANSCTGTQNYSVNINCGVVTVALGTDITQCPGSVTLDAGNAGGTYVWNTPDVTQTISVSTSGNYAVTVTDAFGCTGNDDINVTLNDTTKPVITCPGDVTVNSDAGNCSAVVNYSLPTATDNCVATTVSQSAGLASGSTFPVGVTTNTFVATDAAGNTETCSFTVTVADTSKPTAVCQNVTVYLDGSGNAFITTAQIENGSTDNCVIKTIVATPLSFTCSNAGANNVTLTVTDSSDNVGTCLATVTVLDTTKPIITCPADLTLYTNQFNCEIFEYFFIDTATATDNCNIVLVTADKNGFDFPIGVSLITWTATDASGNTATCTQNLTVLDTISPIIICPANITVNNDAVNCSAVVNYSLPTATDNCVTTIVSQVTGLASGSTFPVGSTTNTFVATDAAGNTDTCSFTIIVADTSKPTAVCQNVTVYLDGSGIASVTASQVNNSSSDNCGIEFLSVSPSTFTCAELGANTVTLTVTDSAGNSNTCTATVTVTDTISVVIVCPSDISVSNNAGTCGAVVNYTAPITSDNCISSAVPVTVAYSGILPDSIPDFISPNTGTKTLTENVGVFGGGDLLGSNVTLDSVNVRISHTWMGDLSAYLTAPNGTVITLLERPGRPTLNLGCTNNNANLTVIPGTGVGAENTCALSTSILTFAINGQFTAHAGQNLNTINTNGGPANGGWILTVTDSAGGDLGAIRAFTLYFSQIPLSIVTVTQIAGLASGSTFPVGATVNTFVASDGSGTDTCSFTVTVADTSKPSAVCQNLTVQLDQAGNAIVTGAQVNNGSTDNCGIQFLSVTPNTFTCANLGANTVTLTVTDTAGNSSTCSATVTVESFSAVITGTSNASSLLIDENFSVFPPASWVVTNNSAPLGITSWFQGNAAVFPAFNGPANSYAGVNFNSGAGVSTISNWLILPNITLKNGDVFTFRTRTVSSPSFADRLQVRQSTNGASTDVGATDLSIGDFSSLLLDINPTLVASNYPDSWTQYTLTISGLSGPTSGRLAFRYFVTDAGPSGSNSEYIGIDNVQYSTPGDTLCPGDVANLQVNIAGVAGVNPVTVVYTDGSSNFTVSGYTSGTDIAVTPLVTTTYSLVSVTSANGCIATTLTGSAEIAVYPAPTVNATADQIVCKNELTTAVNFTGTGTAFSWTNNQPSIGLAASGTGNIAGFSPVNNGTTPVIASVIVTPSDNNGCVGTPDTFTITVNPGPQAICQNATVYLDANGNVSLGVAQVNNGSTAFCGLQSLSLSPNTFNCSNIGANTVTLTVTDNFNNTGTCTATVTVADTLAPLLACPSNISVNNGTGICGAVVTYTTPTANDNCAVGGVVPVTINQTGLPVAIPDNTPTGVTNTLNVSQFGAGDLLGGAVNLTGICFNLPHTWVGDLIVSLRSPNGTIVTLMDRPGVPNSTFGCSQNNINACVDLGIGTGMEAVCNTSTSTNNTTFAISGTFKAHNGANLNSLNTGGGNANGNWALIVSDNGGGDLGTIVSWSLSFTQSVSAFVAITQAAGLPSGSTFPVGNTTNTFVATDANGNSNTCSFTVTVADTTKPTAVCQNITVQLDQAGNATVTGAQVNNNSTDNCGIQLLSVSPNTFTCANIGANTVTLTVTDSAGNSSTCSATVTVNSYTATLTGSPLATTQLINEGFAVVPPAGWVITNNSSPLGTTSWFQGNAAVFPAFNGPTNSYAGANFNNTTGNNTISNWLILPNITLKNGDVFTFRARATDAFADRLQVRLSTNGASANVGNTNVSTGDFSSLLLDINPTLTLGVFTNSWTQYTVTVSGLGTPTSGRLAFRYFVTNGGPAGANSDYMGIDDVVYTSIGDTICVGEPANLTVTTTGGASPYTVVYSNGVTPTTVTPYISGTNIPVSPTATTTYTLVSVTDANGCVASPASGTATIAVYPVVTVAATADQAVCNNQSTNTVTFTGTGTSYNWTNNAPSIGLAASGTGNISAFTATNTGGAPVVAQIIVTPTSSVTGCFGTPDTFTITVTPNLTVNPTADQVLCVNQNSAAVNFTGTGAAYSWTNDNTAVGLAANGIGDIASFVATNTGTTPLVATVVVTPSGNACPVTNDTFTITVNPGPVAVCQDVTVYLDGTGSVTVSAAQVNNGSTAGCGIQSLTVSPNTFNCGTTGANTVTLTLTDNGGNVATCQATVTVLDTIGPIIICPSDITVGNTTGLCGAIVNYTAPTATDNCVTSTVSQVAVNQTGLPQNITDNNATGVTNTLNVSQFSGADALGGSVILNTVCFTINHTWIGDLKVSLKAPNGTIIPLVDRPGVPAGMFGCSQNNINTCVQTGTGADMESVCDPSTLITTYAISGNYFAHAGADLNAINLAGGLANGAWELIVSDNEGGDVGTIQAWSLNFTQTSVNGVLNYNQIAGLASGSTFPIGTTTNTFVVEDANGNTDTCSFDVVVSDTEAPKFGVQNCTGGTFTIQITDAGVGFMDEVDWTLTDGNNIIIASGGNYTTLSVTEIVNGTTGPYVFNITSAGTFDDNVANYSISCNGNVVASGIVVGTFFGGTGTATSANFCCVDGFCSTDLVVNAAQGACDAVVTYEIPFATDNCLGVTQSQTSGLPSGATFPTGNTTITYEAIDVAGNISTCTFKVTVLEVTPPTAVCQDVTAYLDATGNVTITAAQVDGGSFDNCGIDSLSLSKYTFSCRDAGQNTVVLFVTDLSGNVDACNATVTIVDTIPYRIVCPSDITINNNTGVCGAVVTFPVPTTTDNCVDTVFLSQSFDNFTIISPNSVACTGGGTHRDNSYYRVYDLNTYGYTAGNDLNVTDVQFGIELADATSGSQPATINLYTLSGPFVLANLTLVATQNITIADQTQTIFTAPITVTIPGGSQLVVELFTPNGQVPGNLFFVGSNSSGQTGTTYLRAPICGAVEPTDVATLGFPNMEMILNVLSVPTASVTQIAGLPSGSTFPVGTTVVTYAADNGSGAKDTCSFNVVVNDAEFPFAVCQDITVYLNANGKVAITAADIDNGSTDNCGIESLVLSIDSFNCAQLGTNTVTLTVTDTAGNASTCTSTVTVLDTVPPVAVCNNFTAYLDANGNVTVTGLNVGAGATDNCEIASIDVTPNAFTCAAVGDTVVVTVTFEDASGNTSFCTAEVYVLDSVSPVAVCRNINIQLAINGLSSITAAQINNGSTDNCGIETISVSPNTFNCSNIGLNTVTLTLTDSSGNVSTCTAIVTVDPSATIDSFGLSNYNGFNISCYGSTDGTATVFTTSAFPVTYLWSNGQTTQTATGLAAGEYFITVTAGTCEFVDSVTLTQPDSLSINPVLSNYNGFGVRCFGSNDGTITLNVTGGVPAYNYAWPSSSAIGNSYTANGLLPGIYSITVTDLNGCTKVSTSELTEPTQVQTSISAVAPKCNGGTDGTATVVASGGTSVFTYLWNTVPAQTNATATGLRAGTYTVTVSDGNGCTSVNSITIAQPAALVAIAQRTSNFNGFGVNCFGSTNGTGSVNVIGGTAPYNYTWSSGTVSGNTVSGLGVGTFRVTVTDANGCTALDSIVVNQPSRLTVAAAVTSNFNGAQISCNGATDGVITSNATGGVAPYFYDWNTNPAQSSKVAIGLGAGTYRVTITDLNGCNDTASATITAPALIVANGAVTSNFNGFGVSCFGGNNGTATITATGGTGTLTYTWPASTGLGNTASGTSLSAGTYVVTVKDVNNCVDTAVVTITQPSKVAATIAKTDARCFGSSDGKAWVTVSGGVPGYTYSWNTNPVQTTDTASNLLAGTYTVVVSDQNGCSSTVSVVVGEPTLLIASANGEGVTCPSGNDGKATATVTGGTTPYTFAWSTTPAQTGATATGLTAGTYTVTVTDGNGCTATDTAVIIVKYPTLPTATLSGGGSVCADESRPSIFITFTGFPPYNFTLSNGTSSTNYTGVTQSPLVVVNPDQGTYTITNFSDAHCTGTVSGSAVVRVNPIPQVVVTGGGFVCDGEILPSVEVEFTGTAPWDVVIRIPEGRDTLITGITNTPLVFNPTTEGFYIVRSVSDSNGCVAFNLNASKEVGFFLLPLVDAGEPKTVDKGFSVKLDGRVITANGGVVNYEWTPDSTLNNAFIEQPLARPFVTTLYTLTATDKNNCKANDTVTVTVSDRIIIDVINVFTPDGDGINEFFVIRNRDAFGVLELTIINRWQQILYESDDYANNWDGTWKGKPVDDGTYYYVIKDVASGKTIKGAVTILRNNE